MRACALSVTLCLFLGSASVRAEKIYYTKTGELLRAEFSGSQIETFAPGPGRSTLFVDQQSLRVYWAQWISGSDSFIRRAEFNGGIEEDLVTWSSVPGAIAVDESGGVLYWTETSLDRIQKGFLDAGNQLTLFAGLNDPKGLTLDLAGGKIYWIDRESPEGGTWRIQRGDVDGSNIVTIVGGLIDASAIVVDDVNAHLYWLSGSAVRRSDLVGLNAQHIIDAPGATYLLLDSLSGGLYWNGPSGIQRANLDGSGLQLIVPETDLTGLALDPTSGDCNSNGVLDAADIAAGGSLDCNDNGIPDECLWKENDCNGTGVPDECEIASGTSFDCNDNGTPDECDVTLAPGKNLQQNSITPPFGFDIRIFAAAGLTNSKRIAISEGGGFGEFIYATSPTGIVRFDRDGNFNNFFFETDLIDLAFAPGSGPWGSDLYALSGSGVVWRIAPNTSSSQVTTALVDPTGLVFGFDEQMYVGNLDATRIVTVDPNGDIIFFAGPFNGTTDDRAGLAFGRLGDLGEFLIADGAGVIDVDGNLPGIALAGHWQPAFATPPFGEDVFSINCTVCFAKNVGDVTTWLLYGTSVSLTGHGQTSIFTGILASTFHDLAFGQGGAFGQDLYVTTGSRIYRISPTASFDCDASGIPDECEALADCNVNGIPDACDIPDETSTDCNLSSVPDECELDFCLTNGLSEICDAGAGTNPACCESFDCNGNGVLDLCDTFSGTSGDDDGDGFPNECGKIYVGAGLFRANPNGSNMEQLFNVSDGIALDLGERKLYRLFYNDDIRRSNLDGSNQQILIETHRGETLALDPIEDRLYWSAGSGVATIMSSDLDGSDVKTILYTGHRDLHSLAIDPFRQKLYWADEEEGIWRANVDGTDVEQVHAFIPNTGPRSIALDPCGGKIYWSAIVFTGGLGLERADLDGSNVETVAVGRCSRGHVAVDLLRQKLFTSCAGVIERRNLDGTNVETVFDFSLEGDIAFDDGAPDCNANGIFDGCEITAGFSQDCNANGVPDACDIADGTSDDCDNNLVPDECDAPPDPSNDCNLNAIPDVCETNVVCDCSSLNQCSGNGECVSLQSCQCNEGWIGPDCSIQLVGCCMSDGSCAVVPSPDCSVLGDFAVPVCTDDENGTGISDACECAVPAPATADLIPDASGNLVASAKSRAISFHVQGPGRNLAARVILVDLPAPFDVLNGESMWVGPPESLSERGAEDEPLPGDETFNASSLQCDAFYTNWSALGAIHVSHPAVIPGAIYELELVDSLCDAGEPANFSDRLSIVTSSWGEVAGPNVDGIWTATDGSVDIGTDIIAIINKFVSLSTAPIKARVDLEPADLDHRINISDVLFGLDGFRRIPYPFSEVPSPCGL